MLIHFQEEIEDLKARVKEMEEEAEKLKEIQGEVEKQMMSTAKSREFLHILAHLSSFVTCLF